MSVDNASGQVAGNSRPRLLRHRTSVWPAAFPCHRTRCRRRHKGHCVRVRLAVFWLGSQLESCHRSNLYCLWFGHGSLILNVKTEGPWFIFTPHLRAIVGKFLQGHALCHLDAEKLFTQVAQEFLFAGRCPRRKYCRPAVNFHQDSC